MRSPGLWKGFGSIWYWLLLIACIVFERTWYLSLHGVLLVPVPTLHYTLHDSWSLASCSHARISTWIFYSSSSSISSLPSVTALCNHNGFCKARESPFISHSARGGLIKKASPFLSFSVSRDRSYQDHRHCTKIRLVPCQHVYNPFQRSPAQSLWIRA